MRIVVGVFIVPFFSLTTLDLAYNENAGVESFLNNATLAIFMYPFFIIDLSSVSQTGLVWMWIQVLIIVLMKLKS
jgi:hypothetical protein